MRSRSIARAERSDTPTTRRVEQPGWLRIRTIDESVEWPSAADRVIRDKAYRPRPAAAPCSSHFRLHDGKFSGGRRRRRWIVSMRPSPRVHGPAQHIFPGKDLVALQPQIQESVDGCIVPAQRLIGDALSWAASRVRTSTAGLIAGTVRRGRGVFTNAPSWILPRTA